jgi:mono/diheme cytochrome c family protein
MKRLVLAVVAVTAAIVFCAPLYGQDKAAQGQKVFAREKCGVCHSLKWNSLDDVGTKLTAERIREWIVDPTEAAEKSKSTSKIKMPVKKLSPEDVDALVAYLQTLKGGK